MLWYMSTAFAKLGLSFLARLLNHGHWYDYKSSCTICCRWCGLESAYWDETSCASYQNFSSTVW